MMVSVIKTDQLDRDRGGPNGFGTAFGVPIGTDGSVYVFSMELYLVYYSP